MTLRYHPDERGGRLLIYCDKCRIELATGVATAIPLSIVNLDPDGVMARLYREGFTSSEPGAVADMVRLPSSKSVGGAKPGAGGANAPEARSPQAAAGSDVTGEDSGVNATAELTWDAGLDRDDYSQACVRDRDRLADAARAARWGAVLKLLQTSETRLSANHWRLGGKSLFTPLHQAAWHGASPSVVGHLIGLGGSTRLPTADGQTPFDIAAARGYERLLPILEPAIRNPVPDEVLAVLDRRLVDLVEGRIRPALTVRVRPLPMVLLTELEPGTSVWFPIPGMYGGFAVRLEQSYLDVKSWSRVVGGSGQAHVITAEGATLVAEGFV